MAWLLGSSEDYDPRWKEGNYKDYFLWPSLEIRNCFVYDVPVITGGAISIL